jgi:hypothetical protein
MRGVAMIAEISKLETNPLEQNKSVVYFFPNCLFKGLGIPLHMNQLQFRSPTMHDSPHQRCIDNCDDFTETSLFQFSVIVITGNKVRKCITVFTNPAIFWPSPKGVLSVSLTVTPALWLWNYNINNPHSLFKYSQELLP